MRKGSKEAKAWGRKMKRLREGKSTKKGMRRKTARRAFEGLKKRFFEVIEQNNYLKEKEWMDFGEKYFFNFKSGINGFQLIKKNIKKIFDENKLLSDTKLN